MFGTLKRQEGMDSTDSLEFEWKGLEKQMQMNWEKGVVKDDCPVFIYEVDKTPLE